MHWLEGILMLIYSPGQIVEEWEGARSTMARRIVGVPVVLSEGYVTADPSPNTISHRAGLTLMSLCAMNGTPLRISRSRLFTTNPSKWKTLWSIVRVKWVSPTTSSGELPSAWWAPWEVDWMCAPMCFAACELIKFPVAPLSRVTL